MGCYYSLSNSRAPNQRAWAGLRQGGGSCAATRREDHYALHCHE